MTMTDQNFTIVAGDSLTLTITVTEDSSAKDITGATIRWQAAPSVNSQTSSVSKTTGSGITITDAANGVFTVTLDPADSTGLSGDFYHEAEITDAGGDISTVLTGRMTVKPALINA